MPPRHQTLPAAQTSSAREAQKSFYCELCSKGYSRMNDYEAHLSSYDHTHKQRFMGMKAIMRDSNATAKARKAEAKADGMISIKIQDKDSGASKKSGFKKSGFKSAFAPVGSAAPAVDNPAAQKDITTGTTTTGIAITDATNQPEVKASTPKHSLVESDTDDEGYEPYDPRFPTD